MDFCFFLIYKNHQNFIVHENLQILKLVCCFYNNGNVADSASQCYHPKSPCGLHLTISKKASQSTLNTHFNVLHFLISIKKLEITDFCLIMHNFYLGIVLCSSFSHPFKPRDDSSTQSTCIRRVNWPVVASTDPAQH